MATRAIRPTSPKRHSSNKTGSRSSQNSFGMIRRTKQSFLGHTLLMGTRYNKHLERRSPPARHQIATTLPSPYSQSPHGVRNGAHLPKTWSCSVGIPERFTNALGNAVSGMAVRMTGSGMRKKATHANHGSAACVQSGVSITFDRASESTTLSSISAISTLR